MKDIEITLKGFQFREDGILPDDFEVYLLILNDGSLSAACWDTGLYARQGGAPGCFRQSRGMIIDFDYVKAWLRIEDKRIEQEL